MTDAPTAGVLVDSNVLLDLFTDDPAWASWSQTRLAEAFDAGQVGHARILHNVAIARR